MGERPDERAPRAGYPARAVMTCHKIAITTMNAPVTADDSDATNPRYPSGGRVSAAESTEMADPTTAMDSPTRSR